MNPHLDIDTTWLEDCAKMAEETIAWLQATADPKTTWLERHVHELTVKSWQDRAKEYRKQLAN